MGVPGGIGGHAALGGAGRPGVRRGGRGPGALGPGSQSVRHRGCARADPSRGGKLTQSPTLRRFRVTSLLHLYSPCSYRQMLHDFIEPSDVDGAVRASSVDADPQASGSSSPGSSPSPGGCCGSRGSSKRDNGEKQH
ncbi:photoreceptor disk component PRCD isoform X2 [Saimiri boliviensis]|uniref:photoreceptor disk component PRCD isoform X2 n=1 Tax=Saimiri boliviensis TaxID=27679 RepID=UPI003D7856DD